MESQWTITSKNMYGLWSADLSKLQGRLDLLHTWREQVIQAGEATDMFIVNSAPSIGFHRGQSKGLAETLADADAARKNLDLFEFTAPLFSPVDGKLFESLCRLYWLDEHGVSTEALVGDFGPVLDSLSTAQDATSESAGHCYGVEIAGDVVTPSSPRQWLTVKFWIRCNIWFPWIHATNDSRPMRTRMREPSVCDNHRLAQVNGARLNSFLAAVAACTERAGGTWSVAEDGCVPYYAPMLSPTGVLLDSAPPEFAMLGRE